jgi:hypothetical protein
VRTGAFVRKFKETVFLASFLFYSVSGFAILVGLFLFCGFFNENEKCEVLFEGGITRMYERIMHRYNGFRF